MLGAKFMWAAFVSGFGIPGIGMAVMLVYTGVSFRFGEICHINISHALQDYWAPLLTFSIAAWILQMATMAYCMRIFVRALFDHSTNNSSGLPSYTASMRTVTARQAYRRVRHVLQLQWRGVALVLIIIGNVVFFAVVFIKLDRAVELTPTNARHAQPWLVCLALSGGDRSQCQAQASALGPNEATLLAMVILLSLVGFWNFVLFARPSMCLGWIDLFRRVLGRHHEYASADPRFTDSKGFEMLATSPKTPDPDMRSPSPAYTPATRSVASATPTERSVHFGHEARYVPPSMSFSGPRPPSSSQGGREWNPQSTFSRGNAR